MVCVFGADAVASLRKRGKPAAGGGGGGGGGGAGGGGSGEGDAGPKADKGDKGDRPEEDTSTAILLPLLPYTIVRMLHLCSDDGSVSGSGAALGTGAGGASASPGGAGAGAGAATVPFSPALVRFVIEACNTQLQNAEDHLGVQVAHEQLSRLAPGAKDACLSLPHLDAGWSVAEGHAASCLLPFVAMSLVAALRLCEGSW